MSNWPTPIFIRRNICYQKVTPEQTTFIATCSEVSLASVPFFELKLGEKASLRSLEEAYAIMYSLRLLFMFWLFMFWLLNLDFNLSEFGTQATSKS